MDGDDLFSDKAVKENVSIGGETAPVKTERKEPEPEEKFDEKLDIEISEATNDKDKIIFVIETKTDMKEFKKQNLSVQRFHEDFVWLYEKFYESNEYFGYIIPSPPTKPDFDSSKSKLQKLSNSDGVLTKEEYDKLKANIEEEYLGLFKKTVSMHELFLKKISNHKALRKDYDFKVFLEYEGPLNIRLKNTIEKASSYFKNITQAADELILSSELKEDSKYYQNQKNFKQEKTVLDNYYLKIKSAASHSESVVKNRKNYAQAQLQGEFLLKMISEAPPASQHKAQANGTFDEDYTKTIKLFGILGDYFAKAQKHEAKIALDDDFKLTDCLKYSAKDTDSARRLFALRNRLLTEVNQAKSNLDKAQAKRQGIQYATEQQEKCQQRFEKFTEVSKEEIQKYKRERAKFFKKNLIELAELQLNNHKEYQEMAKNMLEEINGISSNVLKSKLETV